MKNKFLLSAMLALGALLPLQATATTFGFNFGGPGVSGSVQITYGTATDSKYPQAFEVTGISGTFTDTNNGLNIVNAPIGSLVTLNHATPEPTNLLAPNDFSKFAVASGLPAQSNGAITYDNLFYPGGSPQTGSDYPFLGGFTDVYGLLFNIGGGQVVNFWSDGNVGGPGTVTYGVAVDSAATSLDYVGSGVSITPEPGALFLMGGGLLGLLVWRRTAARKAV